MRTTTDTSGARAGQRNYLMNTAILYGIVACALSLFWVCHADIFQVGFCRGCAISSKRFTCATKPTINKFRAHADYQGVCKLFDSTYYVMPCNLYLSAIHHADLRAAVWEACRGYFDPGLLANPDCAAHKK